MTDFDIRALIVTSNSTASEMDAVLAAAGGPGLTWRIATAETAATTLDELRFDALILIEGPDTPRTFLSSIPRHLRVPAVAVSLDAEMDGDAFDAVIPRDGLNGEILGRTVREVVSRQRAAIGGGSPERTLIESVGAVLWRADPVSFEFTFVSDEAEAVLGYPAREWLHDASFWVEKIHPSDRDWAVDFCVSATARGEDHEFEYRMIAADGRAVWIRDIVRLVDADGRRELVGVMVDITEAKEAELALRASDERFRQVTDTIEDVFYLREPNRILYVSPAFETIWGRSRAEVYQNPASWLESIHPDDRQTAIQLEGRRVLGATDTTFRILRPDGEIRWVQNLSYPVRNEQGEIYRTAGIVRDISELVAANDKLIQSEAHYRRLVTHSPELVTVLDPDGNITEINRAGEETLGRPAADLIGRPLDAFLAAHSLTALQEGLGRIVANVTERFDIDLRLPHSGSERRVLASFVAIRHEDGLTGIHGIGRDVTEATARDEQMALLTSALDSLDQAVSITDIQGKRALYRNRAWARLVGCDPADALNVSLGDLVPEGHWEQVKEIGVALQREGQWSGRIWQKRLDDGRVIPIDTLQGTAVSRDGGVVVLSIMHDASIDIERETMLRRAERLASLGTLIGGVAHELNNPLHAIRTFAELLLDGQHSDEDRSMLEMTRREADRAARVVSDLRVFARRTQDDSLSRGAVDLNEVVGHAINVRAYTLSTHNIQVVTRLAEGLPPILADSREIEQLVFNLFINAEQAVSPGDSGREAKIDVETMLVDGAAVLRVADNGHGIDSRNLELIFDPFFTTKAPGDGTGLGLSLVHRIVQEHGGEIDVDSAPGRGTTFTVRLPLAPADRPAAPPRAAPTETPRASLRVLVVDDEASIRQVMAAFLKRHGHVVDLAREGEEALALIADNDYDVLISDLRMPGIDGVSLLRQLRDGRHTLAERTVFLTGDPPSDPSVFDVPILAKPVRMQDVAEMVAKLGGLEPIARAAVAVPS